jgi:hypothetical protein
VVENNIIDKKFIPNDKILHAEFQVLSSTPSLKKYLKFLYLSKAKI